MKTTADNRSKSLSDLYKQWNRIFDAITLRSCEFGYRLEFEGRIEKINNALKHYTGNICKHFRGHVSNSDFIKQVSRNIYVE